MKSAVYLRPLNPADAIVSFKWRNNPLIWKYTHFRPSEYVTKTIESKWLEKVLNNENEYRFAICLKKNGKYVGNVQIIDIKDKTGEFHIFIGETSYWGKGIGQEATALMLDYGFTKLGLEIILLQVHKENQIAKSIYNKMGFHACNDKDDFVEMVINKNDFSLIRSKSVCT